MTFELGRLVAAIVRDTGAKRVLEIGAGFGRSSVQIARALPAHGLLITIERSPSKANLARRLIDRYGCTERVLVIVGDPARYLHKLAGPFPIVVQTGAERPHFGRLHDGLVKLLEPGGTLVTYNLGQSDSYNEVLAADPRLRTATSTLRLGAAISILRSETS